MRRQEAHRHKNATAPICHDPNTRPAKTAHNLRVSNFGNQERRYTMRISSLVAIGALLAATPAMAQVIVTTPGNDAASHQYQADQERATGRQEMNAARANAAMGNYAAAAQDQAAARQNWHAAHHEEHAANRDGSAPIVVQLGH